MPKDETNISDTDLGSFVAALARRNRVQASAVRGLGARLDEGLEARVARAIADDIEDLADALAAVPAALCPSCGTQDVKIRFEIGNNPNNGGDDHVAEEAEQAVEEAARRPEAEARGARERARGRGRARRGR